MREYYRREIDRIAEKVREIPDRRFAFVFAADMHADYAQEWDGVMRQCEAMAELANRIQADCLILGGDLLHGTSSREDCLDYLRAYAAVLGRADMPALAVRGNHDDNAYHNDPWIPPYDPARVPWRYIVGGDDWCGLLVESLARGRAVHDPENAQSTYYYMDFPEKKTRVIVTDAYAYPMETRGEYALWTAESWDRFSDRQLMWFARHALDTSRDGWMYILASHGPLTDGFVIGPCRNAGDMLDMIRAFNAREKYVHPILGIEADYTHAASVLPLHVFGHTHRDGYAYAEQARLAMLNIGNCKVGEYDCSGATVPYCVSPRRERDGIGEALFDVMIYTDGGTLHRIRFGAGADQFVRIGNAGTSADS